MSYRIGNESMPTQIFIAPKKTAIPPHMQVAKTMRVRLGPRFMRSF